MSRDDALEMFRAVLLRRREIKTDRPMETQLSVHQLLTILMFVGMDQTERA